MSQGPLPVPPGMPQVGQHVTQPIQLLSFDLIKSRLNPINAIEYRELEKFLKDKIMKEALEQAAKATLAPNVQGVIVAAATDRANSVSFMSPTWQQYYFNDISGLSKLVYVSLRDKQVTQEMVDSCITMKNFYEVQAIIDEVNGFGIKAKSAEGNDEPA